MLVASQLPPIGDEVTPMDPSFPKIREIIETVGRSVIMDHLERSKNATGSLECVDCQQLLDPILWCPPTDARVGNDGSIRCDACQAKLSWCTLGAHYVAHSDILGREGGDGGDCGYDGAIDLGQSRALGGKHAYLVSACKECVDGAVLTNMMFRCEHCDCLQLTMAMLSEIRRKHVEHLNRILGQSPQNHFENTAIALFLRYLALQSYGQKDRTVGREPNLLYFAQVTTRYAEPSVYWDEVPPEVPAYIVPDEFADALNGCYSLFRHDLLVTSGTCQTSCGGTLVSHSGDRDEIQREGQWERGNICHSREISSCIFSADGSLDSAHCAGTFQVYTGPGDVETWCGECRWEDMDAIECACCGSVLSDSPSDHECYSCEGNVWGHEYGEYDDDDYDEEDDEDRGIQEYSYRPSPTYFRAEGEQKGDPKTLYMGIEIEVDGAYGSKEDSVDAVNTTYLKGANIPVFYCKSDCSLEYGYEVVSHPTTFKLWRDSAPAIADTLGILKSSGWDTEPRRAGMHIHLSRRPFTGLHLFKFAKLFLDGRDGSTPLKDTFACKVSGRVSYSQLAEYANLKDEDQSIARKITKGNYRDSSNVYGDSRFLAVNLENKNTVELRLFQGSILPADVYRNLEVAYSAYVFTQNAPLSKVNPEEYKKFLAANKDEFPLAHTWLDSGYNKAAVRNAYRVAQKAGWTKVFKSQITKKEGV